MLTRLLTTKLHVPPLRPSLVPRPRLAARLAEGLARPVTLISAPPGSGKTTLVGEWRASEAGRALPLAWLALDEDDNDPPRWLTYVIAALETVAPGMGSAALDLFNAPVPPTPNDVLTSLLNRLEGLDTPLVLALDDYHAITNPAIHAAMAYFIEHLPPPVRLLILTRADPPLPLGRLRVRGQLTEIRSADLRFTLDEVAAFLQQAGLTLSLSDIKALEARTEGWAAGLQLAALSLQGQPQVDQFIRSFTGSDAYLVDYLGEEVLTRLPEDVQDFLLQTSVLNYLTAPLCDALTERTDSQALLDQLIRANLFLIPIDPARRWFRYHRLFTDLLRYRLAIIHPSASAALYHRLSEWFTASGLTGETLRLALAGLDLAVVAQAVERSVGAGYAAEHSLLQWIEALPDTVIRANSALCLTHAWALVPVLQFQAAEARIADAIAASGSAPEVVAEGQIVRSFIAQNTYQPRLAIERAQQALSLLDDDRLGWRSLAGLSLGMAYTLDGQIQAALPVFEQAAAWGLAAGQANITLHVLRNLGLSLARSGRLREAVTTYERALALTNPPSAGGYIILVSLADIYYEWNELGRATDLLNRAADLSRQWGNWRQLSECHLSLARLLQVQGDTAAAAHHTAEATRLKEAHHLGWLSPYHDTLHIRLGDAATALRWAASPECHTRASDPPEAGRTLQQLMFARALLARQRAREVAPFLGRVRGLAEVDGRVDHAIGALILEALAYQQMGETMTAEECLHQAFTLAAPQGYRRLFVDAGPAMADLLDVFRSPDKQLLEYSASLRRLLPDRAEGTVEDGLLEAPPIGSVGPTQLTPTESLVESLSEREIEILHLVAEGASNRAIADQLVLALGTVKTHVHNIYGKLGVASRTQAIARGRALGILDTPR